MLFALLLDIPLGLFKIFSFRSRLPIEFPLPAPLQQQTPSSAPSERHSPWSESVETKAGHHRRKQRNENDHDLCNLYVHLSDSFLTVVNYPMLSASNPLPADLHHTYKALLTKVLCCLPCRCPYTKSSYIHPHSGTLSPCLMPRNTLLLFLFPNNIPLFSTL